MTEYTAAVPSDVTSITVSAPAKDGGAKVAVSGNDDLQDGENTITCTVTAEDGETTKTYTIMVTKSDDAAVPTVRQMRVPQRQTQESSVRTAAGLLRIPLMILNFRQDLQRRRSSMRAEA